jgi:molybdopterin-containing oxidoreductase family iron-sulfur binding subunit
MSDVDQARRHFVGWGSAALAGIALAPGFLLYDYAHGKAPGESASSKARWGILVDTTRCKPGCHDCVDACNREHRLPGATGPTDAQWIRKIDLTSLRGSASHSLPMMCQHCADPPCVDVCPTGASFKRDDGIVLVDRHTCIGCRYCMMACPYQARSFVHEPTTGQGTDAPRGKGCVESCTLCVHRVDRGAIPACVEACGAGGHHAMIFGDLNDPDSEVSGLVEDQGATQMLSDLGTRPRVFYIPVNEPRKTGE